MQKIILFTKNTHTDYILNLKNNNSSFNKMTNFFNFKRNYLFLKDFKYYSKFLFMFTKNWKKYIYITQFHISSKMNSNQNKDFKTYLLFVAEPHDCFFYNLFIFFTQKYQNISFFIEWNVSKFFYFLNKRKSASNNFFPVIFLSPYLAYNKEFMRILNIINIYPVFFFFEKNVITLNKILYCNNVFPVFLTKKNNFKFLLTFLKLFTKFI